MRLSGKSTLIAVVLALAGLLLSACGSSSKSASSGGSGGSAAASSTGAKPTGSPIKIGYAVAESGTEGVQGTKSVAVAQAWEQWVNANGGIDGHPVDILIKNSAGDPATMLAAVQDFVNTEGVAAVMTYDDTAEPAAGQFLTSKNIPVIGATGFTTTLWSAEPNYYTVVTQIPYTLLGQTLVGKAVGAKKMGDVVCAEVAACAQAGPLFKSASTALGVDFVGQLTASASAPNYAATCLGLTQKGADFISLALTSSVGIRFMKDCSQQGFQGYYGIDAAFDQTELNGLSGVKIIGNAQAFPWWSSAAPVKNFRNVMAKYQPRADYHNFYTTSVWTSLELFRSALGNVGPGAVTPEVVTQAYSQVKNQTLGGLLPQPVTFTAGKPAPTMNCQWLFSYQSGGQPKTLTQGPSGNGATGDLASTCASQSLIGSSS